MKLSELINAMYDAGLSGVEIDLRVQQIISEKYDKNLPFFAQELDRFEVLFHMMKSAPHPNMYGENSKFYFNGLYQPSKIVVVPRLYFINVGENLMVLGNMHKELHDRKIKYRAYHSNNFNEIIGTSNNYEQPGIVDTEGNPISSKDERYIQFKNDISFINENIYEKVLNSPDYIYKMKPTDFEEFVADLLYKRGYEVKLTPKSNDGGIDIFASHKTDLGSFLYLVQCKRNAPKNKVGIQVVRELNGVLEQKQATAGLVVTSSFFTKNAREFQSDIRYRMNLWDYADLITKIKETLYKT